MSVHYICLYIICGYILYVYMLCMSSVYYICHLYMICLGTIVSTLYVYVLCVYALCVRYNSLDTIYVCALCVYMLYVYTFVYVLYVSIHWYLYNMCILYDYTCICTAHISIHYTCLYTMYDAYTLYVYELCVSIYYICLYTIYNIHTLYGSAPYMCLYTLVLGNRQILGGCWPEYPISGQPGSVKDTRKSDRKGLLTLTSGLHTCTQIWKQHTSSCHTHKPALLGAVKMMSPTVRILGIKVHVLFIKQWSIGNLGLQFLNV